MEPSNKFPINEKTEKAWEKYKDNQDGILGHWNQRGPDYIEPKCKNIDNRTQLEPKRPNRPTREPLKV